LTDPEKPYYVRITGVLMYDCFLTVKSSKVLIYKDYRERGIAVRGLPPPVFEHYGGSIK
jgi:hypothetical protein